MKILRKCKCGLEALIEEDLELFSKQSRCLYGRNNECINCYNTRMRERNKEQYEKHKEKRKQKALDYYYDNADKVKAQHKEYNSKNKEYRKQKDAEYHKENPEKTKVSNRKRRALKQEVEENFLKTDEQYIRFIFQDKCFSCGSENSLCFDHSYPLSLGYALTRSNCTLLCQSCNSTKGTKLPEEVYTEEQIEFLNSLKV